MSTQVLSTTIYSYLGSGALSTGLSLIHILCEIRLNKEPVKMLIGPPYTAELELAEGENVLELYFPVTPVYESGDAWSALTVLKPFGLQETPVLSVKAAKGSDPSAKGSDPFA